MNPWPITRMLVTVAIAASALLASEPSSEVAPTDATSIEITVEQAKEMILDFISEAEANEKKVGAKGPFFISASRPVLEKQDMVVHDDRGGILSWGPWGVDPRKGSVWLHTDLKDNSVLAWSLSGRIKQIGGKYRLVDAKVFTVRPKRIKQTSK